MQIPNLKTPDDIDYTENAERAHLSHAKESKYPLKPHVCSHLSTEGLQSFLGGCSSRGQPRPQCKGTDLEKRACHLYPVSIPAPQKRIPLLPQAIGSNARASRFKDKEAVLSLQSILQSCGSEEGKSKIKRKLAFYLASIC